MMSILVMKSIFTAESRHEKKPEYSTAGAGIGVRVCSDRGKRISPVFSSVEKAQDYVRRR